jgi:hypothetical protein
MKELFLLLFISLWLNGCCIKLSRNEPDYPKNSNLGWRDSNIKERKIAGHFVLKKGEQTEYSGLRVEVIDIIDNNCLGAFERSPILVKLKFTKTAYQKVVCEETRVETSSGMIGSSCEELREFGIEFIGVRAINVRENWADFELSGLD